MSDSDRIPYDRGPFNRSQLLSRTPPSNSNKRQLETSPTDHLPIGKRQIMEETSFPPLYSGSNNSSPDQVAHNLSSRSLSSPPVEQGYPELVANASEYLRAINDLINDQGSRINIANKTAIMDLTQRVTAIVSILATKSACSETKLAIAQRDLALGQNTTTTSTTVKPPPRSYSEALNLRLPKVAPPLHTRTPLPCVVAYPTEEKEKELTSSSATKQVLMKAINPVNDGFQIAGVKKTAKSGVVLRVTSQSQIKKLESVDAIKSAGLRLEKPQGRRPRILVKDIPSALNDKSFLTALYRQNIKDEIQVSEDQFLKSTKIVRCRTLNDGYKWIGIELDPLTRRHLVNTKEKLFIDWATCRFIDDIELVRCLKCQQYGHVSKYCKEKDECCSHCAENHASKDCPKKSCDDFRPICATCKRLKKPCDHPTGSADCPTYKNKLEVLVLNTQYE